MKAIDTPYNGYLFRSRLEARWAVFFDTLGIPWEYEKEGYDLEGTWYLPDFWLPQQDCWIEIKGQEPTPGEFNKAFLLAWHSGKPVYLFAGEIGSEDIARCAHYTFGWVTCTIQHQYEDYQARLTTTYQSLREAIWPEDLRTSIKSVEDLATQQNKALKKIMEQEQERDPFPVQLGELHVFFPFAEWAECLHCHKVIIIGNLFNPNDTTCQCAKTDGWVYTTSKIKAAYVAARQARFEHRHAAF